MALSRAQEALIDRILDRARGGQLARPFQSGDIEATMANPQTLRLKISGANARALTNDWVSTCAAKAGNAEKRPSPGTHILIDIRI